MEPLYPNRRRHLLRLPNHVSGVGHVVHNRERVVHVICVVCCVLCPSHLTAADGRRQPARDTGKHRISDEETLVFESALEWFKEGQSETAKKEATAAAAEGGAPPWSFTCLEELIRDPFCTEELLDGVEGTWCVCVLTCSGHMEV